MPPEASSERPRTPTVALFPSEGASSVPAVWKRSDGNLGGGSGDDDGLGSVERVWTLAEAHAWEMEAAVGGAAIGPAPFLRAADMIRSLLFAAPGVLHSLGPAAAECTPASGQDLFSLYGLTDLLQTDVLCRPKALPRGSLLANPKVLDHNPNPNPDLSPDPNPYRTANTVTTTSRPEPHRSLLANPNLTLTPTLTQPEGAGGGDVAHGAVGASGAGGGGGGGSRADAEGGLGACVRARARRSARGKRASGRRRRRVCRTGKPRSHNAGLHLAFVRRSHRGRQRGYSIRWIRAEKEEPLARDGSFQN